mgnify:FL=1|jgi:hypothetical protein
MDKHKLRDKQARAEKAASLLRHELFVEAFDYLDTQFIEAWKSSDVKDAEARERIYNLSQALSALRGYFQSVVEDGKLAEAQLEDLQRRTIFNKIR